MFFRKKNYIRKDFSFSFQGWSVKLKHISPEELEKYTGRKYVSGVFSIKDQVIYINNQTPRKSYWDVVYHECGHFIDFVLGVSRGYNNCLTLMEPDIFEDVIKESITIQKDSLYSNVLSEYFAQSYANMKLGTRSWFLQKETKLMFQKLGVV